MKKEKKVQKINDLMSKWENAMMKKNQSPCGRYNEADLETDETSIYAMRMSMYIDDDRRLLRVGRL